MIDVEDLSFTYAGASAPALRGLSFAIARGEIVGFLGPSGAGKSTTQNILIGLLKGYQGRISALGRDLKAWGADYYERIGVWAPALLVMFLCNHCPYVKAVIDRLVDDCRFLAAQGVRAVAIMPNDTTISPADSFDNMQLFAIRHQFPFPYVIDDTQEIARAYGAVCTPDIFGFNAARRLCYRGRVDSAGPKEAGPDTVRELRAAMLQIARTGHGPENQLPSMGCSIKWRPEPDPA